MNFEIKEMTAEYVQGFGYVLYTAWEETYRGLIADNILNERSIEKCVSIAQNNSDNKLVAVCDGKVVGLVGYGINARNFVSDKNSGEIVALYVLKNYQNRGIGKALLLKAIERIGNKSIVLFVLKGNGNAINFYKHMGFEFTGHKLTQKISDSEITELEMILKI